MTGEAWVLLGTLLTVLGTITVAFFKYRQTGRQTRTTDAQQIIDQLQEDRKAADARHSQEMAALANRHQQEIADLRAEVTNVKERVDDLEDRELILLDYAATLRNHIDLRQPPPPPPWPDALMRRRREQRPRPI